MNQTESKCIFRLDCHAMATDEDQDDLERRARIEALLKSLSLQMGDLAELAKRATEQAEARTRRDGPTRPNKRKR